MASIIRGHELARKNRATRLGAGDEPDRVH